MSIVKLNNQAVKNATAFGSITGLGSMIFIKKLTASSSATLSFVDGSDGVVLDDTYKEYVFTFKNIHAQTDQAKFTIGFRDGGTDYDAVKTTTVFEAFHRENDSTAVLGYNTGEDIAQGTGFQTLANAVGNNNDDNCNGIINLFNPSSTVFVKHFISRTSQNYRVGAPAEIDWFVAGYCNTTTAIDGVQFKMSTGNIDAGDICLYGIA
nr:hypothetical protein [uncultured Mediterranean phage uvMED]